MDERGRRHFLVTLGSALGLLGALAALAYFRRDPGRLDYFYDLGDVLGTHGASSMSKIDFGVSLGRGQLAVLATLLVLPLAVGLRSKRVALASFIASMTTFAVVYGDSITRYATTIGGRLYVKHCDDALISMRYARNFAEGRGLVYSAGEQVDGFTNPLWTAIMVIPHALGMHEGVTTVPIVVLGGLLLIASAVFARKVLVDAGADPIVQVLVALLIVFDVSAFEFSVIGLETPLLGMAAALVMAGGLLGREWWVSVGIVVLTLARADGAVIAALLVAWLVYEESATSGDRLVDVAKRRWRHGALLVGVAGALVAWRLAIYGYPAPNTYYLKVYSLVDRVKSGVYSYGVRGILTYGLPVLFVLCVAATDESARRARRLLFPVAGVWLYAMYVGGDAFPYLRFLGPVTPLLWTAVGLAASAVWAKRARWVNAAMFLVLILLAPVKSERGVLGSAWDRRDEIRNWVIAAKTLDRNVPPDAWIGTFFAGLPYYAPKHRFIDMLGKADAHIAHQKTIHGVIPGHNKFDFAYVYAERKPDVTFTSFTCDQTDAMQAKSLETLEGMARDLPPFHFQPAINQMIDPTFRQQYFPHRVILREGDGPAGHPVGCWFVREGSSTPIVWQVAYE